MSRSIILPENHYLQFQLIQNSFTLKYAISFWLLIICIGCSNKENLKLNKKLTLTNYEFLKDSTEIFSILSKTNPKTGKPVNYQYFAEKLLRISFKNNSSENIYLPGPLRQYADEEMMRKFTASIYLLQKSDDSIKWKKSSERHAVDTYDIYYDTIIPNTTLSKLVYVEDYQKEKYLELLVEYRSDSVFYNDTVRIKNNLR
jgi:hypothetical protein